MESTHVAAIANSGTSTSPGARYTAKRISTTSAIVVHSVLRMLSSAAKKHVGADGGRAGDPQLQPGGIVGRALYCLERSL